jgi:hypothetical protein
VRDDVHIDSKMLLMTDFVNLKICVCTIFLKKGEFKGEINL